MDGREPVSVDMLDDLKEGLDYIYQDKRINDKAELLQEIMRSTDYSHYSYMEQDLERFGYVRPFVRDLRGWLQGNMGLS
ncbi:hypothetical protein ERX37_00625 [Macrococcus hajekii]|uniref:Uncharacterized protein n=1 Tax=Macrococcus hajekii TaxID=198482 RepID=A0A4R6BLF6_9STAP|nr:hypothetical protein [Macrococcus hajekii]TDM02624.1 hypothetical protein ERX37_00625 [Macrococcus hajekii]GGB02573.1 hypothetical protein GCM10007190_08170 [Macrococcus hajekii]